MNKSIVLLICSASLALHQTLLPGDNYIERTPSVLNDETDKIKYSDVKMDMSPYFRAMSKDFALNRKKKTSRERDVTTQQLQSQSTVKGWLEAASTFTSTFTDVNIDALKLESYNSAIDLALPVMNQNMCGSCWAIASATALKANLRLKEHGLCDECLPNLVHFIACSNKPSQVVVAHNDVNKWIIELAPTRGHGAGCEGGLSGMALGMLQISGAIYEDNISNYKSGNIGDMGKGPATHDSFYNMPHVTCDKYKESIENKSVRQISVPFDVHTLNLKHLLRRKSVNSVYFPTTRDIRQFIYDHNAAIAYVDIDSGLESKSLYGTNGRAVKLKECMWKQEDFTQDPEDMRAVSQFKHADHAVVITGWSCEKSAWIVQNSWGTEWGTNGSLYLYDKNVCSTDFTVSGHSKGAGPACIFGSSISAFIQDSSN